MNPTVSDMSSFVWSTIIPLVVGERVVKTPTPTSFASPERRLKNVVFPPPGYPGNAMLRSLILLRCCPENTLPFLTSSTLLPSRSPPSLLILPQTATPPVAPPPPPLPGPDPNLPPREFLLRDATGRLVPRRLCEGLSLLYDVLLRIDYQ